MTSAVVVAVLLAASPEAEAPPDGHAVFAKVRQVMLGGARRPWLLLTSGSIARSDDKPDQRFVIEWEPCGRRDVRGPLSKTADETLGAAFDILCMGNPIGHAKVKRNGSHVRYVWDPPIKLFPFGETRVILEIDPATGIIARARVEERWQQYDRKAGKSREVSRIVGTAELSDYRPVGAMRLPHRLRIQSGAVREDWTIERIEIVPLP